MRVSSMAGDSLDGGGEWKKGNYNNARGDFSKDSSGSEDRKRGW